MPAGRIAAGGSGLYGAGRNGGTMRRTAGTMFWAAAIALACRMPAAAQETPTDAEMRQTHAVLLGLAQDGALPERDNSGDIYYSVVENPDAPRLATRLEVSGAPCRARTISALQFPDKWATVTLGLVDLARITSVTAYASVEDMIAETNPVPLDSEAAVQVVLAGEGLYCSSRMSLSGEAATGETCSDRLDLPMMDAEQKVRARRALAIVADFCKAPGFRRR